jgi:pimeloyl-ACP methyl ester carboxylesterase
MAFVKLSGGDAVYYRILPGAADRPYLVFLHEGLGCTAMWKDFPERLCRAADCPGLIYDRSGFGMSPAGRQPRRLHYLHDSALVELTAVLERVISGSPYFLVGHSDGASIALIHASERPDLLRGIIAEAPHVMVESKTLDGIRSTVRSFDDRRLKALFRYHENKAEMVFKAWYTIWLSEGFRHWNIEYLLPSILCPSLILQGKDDPYATDEHAQLIASTLRGPVQLELIDDCGHSPHLDAAGRVLRFMTVFIQKNLSAATPAAQ